MHIVTSEADVDTLKNKIMESVELTVQSIRSCQETSSVMDSLFQLRFHKMGHDPIGHKPLNFVEQINQIFSNMVVLEGARFLIRKYPSKVFYLHLGTESGFDIHSSDNTIIAECFAVTTVKSNDKLREDAKKMIKCETCDERYLFFYSQDDSDAYLDKRYQSYPQICFERVCHLY